MKSKTKFVCGNCGAESPRWMGRCPMCGAWNTMSEMTERPETALPAAVGEARGPVALSNIDIGEGERLALHMPEVDRTLGGGIVQGSVILMGGEPGIGKSTLVFQICKAVSEAGESVLYATGEESERQLKLRADRLGVPGACVVLQGSDLGVILEEAKKRRPALLVIDSIQTMAAPGNASAMGSPAQIRDATALLVRLAKETGISVLIIGHVTKDGNIAGPRLLEHMVDVVLYLEGDRSYQFRVLRTVKNRFGSTAETGLFVMEGEGLRGIENPSGYLLASRGAETPGSIVVAVMEGRRPILAEIQALSVHSSLAVPRRISVGYDYNRLVVLLAVLEKRARISFAADDVYVNVAGGFRVQETAADLAAALAAVSVKWDVPLARGLTAFGEIGLTGAVLPVSHIALRLAEAEKMGFDRFLLPAGNQKEAQTYFTKKKSQAAVRYVKDIREAVEAIKQ